MPSKKKPATAGMAALPSIPKELIEQLIGGATPMTADQINAINMFWHAKFHKDPANQWLRSLVFDLHADASKGAKG